MTVEELGRKCKEYDCSECPYQKQCSKFEVQLDGISPHGLLKLELD